MNPDKQQIQQFTQHWIESWNSHDLDAIISHYAGELNFISALIVDRFDREKGTITDRNELRSHFKLGLESNPSLHFKLEEILYSVKGFSIYYKNAQAGKTAEYFELNDEGKVVLVINSYSAKNIIF